LELGEICDVSFDLQVAGKLDAGTAFFLVLFFVDLDYADERLAIDLWVVVDDHVDALVDSADAL